VPTYISLVHLTDQGIRDVKHTTERAKAFVDMAAKAGVKVRDLYWTQGTCDLVTITEAADEETATALLLAVGALGNIRTETMRAYTSDEMKRILSKMP
jgi:uncharacterized protein with GYD domain